MKKIGMLLCLTLLLSGCFQSMGGSEQQYNEKYENFMELLIDNSKQISTNIPFDWDFQMEQTEEGYTYTVKISNPRVAMSNVQMIGANLEEINETQVAPSIGIFEDTVYNMIPNQVNVEKGYYEGMGISGISSEKAFVLNCLVVYKDKNQTDNYVYFIINANYDDFVDSYRDVSPFENIIIKGDKISGTVNAKSDGYFNLSIPYDKGFTIYLNQKEVEYEMVNNGFIGIPVQKGFYEVEILYNSPMLKEAKIISVLGITIYAFVIIIEKNRKRKIKSIAKK